MKRPYNTAYKLANDKRPYNRLDRGCLISKSDLPTMCNLVRGKVLTVLERNETEEEAFQLANKHNKTPV